MSIEDCDQRCEEYLARHENPELVRRLLALGAGRGPIVLCVPDSLVPFGGRDAGAAGGTSAGHEAGADVMEEGMAAEASPTVDCRAEELSDEAGPSESVCKTPACRLTCGLQHECPGVNGIKTHLAAAALFFGKNEKVTKMCADCRQARRAYEHRAGGVLDQKSAEKLQQSRDAEHANARLLGIVTYDERALQRMAEAFMHGIAHLLQAGSPSFCYGFAFCVKSAAGIAASDEEVNAEEWKESLNTFQTNPNPLVRVPDRFARKGWRPVKHADVFGTALTDPAVIERLLVTSILSDVKIAERYLHVLLDADKPGFRGNLRKGGVGKMKGPYLFGVSVLVIPSGLTAMGLEVRADHRDAFLAACTPDGGRRVGIGLPPQQPPGPFPQKDARGGFVLGGPVMLDARGLLNHQLRPGLAAPNQR
jgi:hypothetical protein